MVLEERADILLRVAWDSAKGRGARFCLGEANQPAPSQRGHAARLCICNRHCHHVERVGSVPHERNLQQGGHGFG